VATQALLDDVPLLEDGDVTWTITSGARHDQAVFSVAPQFLGRLLSGGLRPVRLVIDPDLEGLQALVVEHLYVLSEVARDEPNIAKVLVVDRRWFWQHVHVSRNFNKRRVVGSKRVVAPGSPVELHPLIPRIAYHPATLRSGRPWTAEQALRSVFDSCVVPEQKLRGTRPGINFDAADFGGQIPLEDIELEDSGDEALGRILQYIPHAKITLDRRGEVLVYSASDDRDRDLDTQTGAEQVGFGSVIVVDKARLRPSKINVWFRREHELRFDFEEDASTSIGADMRFIDNVLPIPDKAGLTIGGTLLAQGTWVSLNSYFNAIGAPPFFAAVTSAATWQRLMRLATVPYLDLWTCIRLTGTHAPDAVWMTRIAAIQTHWRRTWRISSQWMARLTAIRAHLIATIDPATGTRAPAKVWADYSMLSSQRSIASYSGDFKNAPYAMNVKSYPDSGKLADGVVSPAMLDVVDADQGIIRFDFRSDPLELYQTFLPGMVTLGARGGSGLPPDAGPTSDITDISRPISFNALARSHDFPQLTSGYKVAILMTGSPATFNHPDNQHMFRVVKTAKEIAAVLPESLRSGITHAAGPELDIFVNSSVETARVQWRDDDALAIEQSIGVREADESKSYRELIRHLVVNLDGDAQGGASLDAVATAVAAQAYALLVDRRLGAKGTPILADAHPIGFVDRVAHTVASSGAPSTMVRWPDDIPRLPMHSLLPDSARRIILRLATARGKDAG
jgi:hypothetical protein